MKYIFPTVTLCALLISLVFPTLVVGGDARFSVDTYEGQSVVESTDTSESVSGWSSFFSSTLDSAQELIEISVIKFIGISDSFAALPSHILGTSSFSWDVEYPADNLPEDSNPSWAAYSSGDPQTNILDGVLTIKNGHSDWIYFQRIDSGLSSDQLTVEARIQVISANNTAECFIGLDQGVGKPYWELELFNDRIELHEDPAVVLNTFNMDTTDDFHTYRLTRDGSVVKVYVDGNLIMYETLSNSASAAEAIYFGSYVSGTTEHKWDYINYLTGGAYPPSYNSQP